VLRRVGEEVEERCIARGETQAHGRLRMGWTLVGVHRQMTTAQGDRHLVVTGVLLDGDTVVVKRWRRALTHF
jgi:hypothetical protein